jgi:NADPH:quinone reductase-like Zn-dependent oxidoreductase
MFIGRAPAGVDLATAGAAPLAGIAAVMAIDSLELSDGETVLIVGATGGVGQPRRPARRHRRRHRRCARAAEDEAYLRELGVSELLLRDGDLATAARERHPDGFDAVRDLVNYAPDVPATLAKEGGRVASPTGAAGEGPGRTMIMAAPTPENLERLARLLADGTLRVPSKTPLRPRSPVRHAAAESGRYDPVQTPPPLPARLVDYATAGLAVVVRERRERRARPVLVE